MAGRRPAGNLGPTSEQLGLDDPNRECPSRWRMAIVRTTTVEWHGLGGAFSGDLELRTDGNWNPDEDRR